MQVSAKYATRKMGMPEILHLEDAVNVQKGNSSMKISVIPVLIIVLRVRVQSVQPATMATSFQNQVFVRFVKQVV